MKNFRSSARGAWGCRAGRRSAGPCGNLLGGVEALRNRRDVVSVTASDSHRPQQKGKVDAGGFRPPRDGVEGTQFVQMDGAWRDLMALKPAAREAFMRSAWAAAAAEQPRVASGGTLSAGDVLFFYTKRIHRAPPPPAAGSPRYTLFGAFCKQGKTDGPPVVQGPR